MASFSRTPRAKPVRVGELDEEMVFESHPNETFILGASTWRIVDITHDRVLVTPAPGEPGKMPFWKGDGPGRPLEFGRRIGAHGARAARAAASRPRSRGSSPSTISIPAPRRICCDFSPTRQRRQARFPTIARLWSSAAATSWATGASAC